jgi:hypothetical protein
VEMYCSKENKVPKKAKAADQHKKTNRKDVLEHRERIRHALTSDPDCARAFERLCTQGCDRKTLTSSLLSFASFEFKAARRLYGVDQTRILGSIASEMRDLSRRLLEFRILLTYGIGVPMEVGTGLPAVLDSSADLLEKGLSTGIGDWVDHTGHDQVMSLIAEVRKATSKPHFKELAILISMAFGLDAFGPENLKALECNYPRRKKS